MRLRDAIGEMGDVRGERVHRSWWVALSGIVGTERSGRTLVLLLAGGQRVTVARDSVHRIQRSGFVRPEPSKEFVGPTKT
jgi:DNA-binding LytR/AlgR family response regulator